MGEKGYMLQMLVAYFRFVNLYVIIYIFIDDSKADYLNIFLTKFIEACEINTKVPLSLVIYY